VTAASGEQVDDSGDGDERYDQRSVFGLSSPF
jgi:hypothetical protein